MKKWLKRILIGIGLILFIPIFSVGLYFLDFWYLNKFKSHIQTLSLPEKNIQFVLMTDLAGFGDPAWYVYQLPLGEKISAQMETGRDKEGTLFWNYSESGVNSDYPTLQIQKGKYLVFSRGRMYHSLYDIETKQVLANDQSPHASFQDSKEYKMISKKGFANEDNIMKEWIRNTLHAKIEKILRSAK